MSERYGGRDILELWYVCRDGKVKEDGEDEDADEDGERDREARTQRT